MFSKSKFKEWVNRYKYAELAATSTALLCSQLSYFFDGVTTAYLITFAEYFAFYSVIIWISYLQLQKIPKQSEQENTFKTIAVLAKNILLEFGYPAVLDFFFLRPFCMYWLPIVTGNAVIGILMGKLCADVVFYFFSIVNYELMKSKNT
ncbi:hypothetical protein FFWV33_10355 [Flavobacterium faecale]|uniref:Uncharacterized protein n=1 Tax=Flavobacterium faecale TaxID=1355330 RepID=A0A2S1LDQ8_9FLAO|nr:hypothetical protein [Flavobacterium faecale]AWG21902.1 hypothetical protein FFWV33_10355 [Flavobacterium faecale]